MNEDNDNKKIERLKRELSGLSKISMSDTGKAKLEQKLDMVDLERTRGRSYQPAGAFDIAAYHIKRAYIALCEALPARAAVSSFAVLAIVINVYIFLPETPRIHGLEGTVKVYSLAKNEWSFAREGQRLGKGDALKTFSDGRADLSYGSLYSIRLRQGSELKVGNLPSKAIRCDMEFFNAQGKVLAYYNGPGQGKKGRHLLINTEEASVSALGTDFMVQASPQSSKTWVGVLEGTVSVTSTDISLAGSAANPTVLLAASYKTQIEKGLPPGSPELMTNDEWLDLRELYSLGVKPQVALLISNKSTRTRELLSELPLFISDKRPSELPYMISKAVKAYNIAKKEDSPEKHLEVISIFKDILKDRPNPKYDVKFMLFIGAYYAKLGMYEESIEMLREVTGKYPDSRLSSIAELAIGIIYEENLHDNAKAIEAYRRILTYYTASLEAEEAEAGLKRLTR